VCLFIFLRHTVQDSSYSRG